MVMHSYRLIIFDWEGTLGDPLGQVFTTLIEKAKELHYPSFDPVLARNQLSLGLNWAIKACYPQLSETAHQALYQEVSQAIITAPTEICLFPHAENLLKGLKKAGFLLAIATNKGQQSLQRALNACKLESLFTATRALGQVPPKPCPQMLEEILKTCKVGCRKALMVGDSVSDIEMAVSLNVDAIGIDFDHQSYVHLKKAGAIDIFDNYQSLLQFLQVEDEVLL